MPSELAVIIESSLTGRKILEGLAASVGVAACSFADAENALSFCRECRPGLVLVGEPAGAGSAADFIRDLRAVRTGADMPVLLIASGEDEDAIERAREAGAADHVLLPVDYSEFRLRARQLLAHRDRSRRSHGGIEAAAMRHASAPDRHELHGMLVPHAGADDRKIEFLHNMSHELRTPLNAIIGFSQVIAGEMLGPVGTPKYAGYARDILDSAEHLLGVINDVLDVSRLEAGTLDLVEESVHVAGAIGEVLNSVAARAEAASIRVVVHNEAPVAYLRADRRKLKQIAFNVLTNAIKFSHPGGVVDVVLRETGGGVAILVEDRGIGMDPQEVELAMSRFGQVATPWSRKHDGIGLGLPLAIGLAELHGAKLTIHSVKGAGTTVMIAFPRHLSEASAVRSATSAGLA